MKVTFWMNKDTTLTSKCFVHFTMNYDFTEQKTVTHLKNGSLFKIVPQQNKTKVQVIYCNKKVAQTLIY